MSKNLIQKLHDILYDDGEHLDLSYAGLKKIPKRVQYAKNLKRLNISGNSIQDIPANVARNLPQIQYLDLSGNKLSSIPESFANNLQYSLISLNLSYNVLNAFPFGPVYMLQHLRELNLSNNGISQISPGISNLKQLENLHLSHNQISLIPEEINALSNLRTLDVSFNLIKTLPDDLGGLSRLEILKLSGNGFTELPNSIQSLTQLRELEMASTELEHLTVDILMKLSQLKRVDLSHNYKLKRIPKSLTNLKYIHHIDMNGNEFARWPAQCRKLENIKCDFKSISKTPCTPSPKNTSEITTLEAPSPITVIGQFKRPNEDDDTDETKVQKPELPPPLLISMENVIQSPTRILNINLELPPPLPEAKKGYLLDRLH